MEKNKEDAVRDFMDRIANSWTWARMTNIERSDFWDAVREWEHTAIFGTYRQRWEILNALYAAFLAGLGYRREPIDWRGNREKEAAPLF